MIATSSIGAGDSRQKAAHTQDVLPTDHDDVLERLKKLSDQLDTAKKSVEVTAKEITRAKDSAASTTKAVRRQRSAKVSKKKRRVGKKR